MNSATDQSNNEPHSSDAVMRVQQLFVRHQGVIKAFILSLQPGFADAEDVLQETFLLVTRRAADFADGSNFVAWACAIARLKLLEARRKATGPGLTEEALCALCEDAPGDSFFQDRLGALQLCLEELAPRAREVVWLRYHSELASQQIAEQLGWQEPAVRVALSKARAFLRECVQGKLNKGRA